MSDRPNIVFVFADDWGWGDLSCYGHPTLKTPRLDALAEQGTIFSQFYVCSGVCSPSRAAVMTGQFPSRFGIHGHFSDHAINDRRGMPNWLPPTETTYTALLKEAGYAVGHFGKWHLGNGEGAPEPFAYGIDDCRVNAGNGPELECGTDTGGGFIPGMRHKSTELIVNHSIRFMKEHKSKPFLINVWLNDTHATLDPSREQLEPYESLRPAGIENKHWGAPAIYYSAVTNADYHIGRLLDALDDQGIADNTLVIFSADNGPEDIVIGNAGHSGVGSPGPFRGRKRSLYEGGVRTPFIMRWPNGGAKGGNVNNETPLCGVDLLPTICDIAGVTVPSDVRQDGEIMSDVFKGNVRSRTTDLFWEWRFRIHGHTLNKSPILSIREGDWKLLFNPSKDRVELYDIPADPMELNNLADANGEKVDLMAKKALDFQSELPEGPFDADAGSNAYAWPGTT